MDNAGSKLPPALFEQRFVKEFTIGFLTWAPHTIIDFEDCGFFQAEKREYETGVHETAGTVAAYAARECGSGDFTLWRDTIHVMAGHYPPIS